MASIGALERKRFRFAAPAPARRPANVVNDIATFVLRVTVVLNTLLCVGNFNPLLLPGVPALAQQVLSIGLWLITIFASFLCQPVYRFKTSPGLTLLWLFYAFATISVLWGNLAEASLFKSVAILITTFGASRLARTLPTQAILADVMLGLFLLCAASVFTSVFKPSIGVLKTWQHSGQWAGVFDSKQTLGTGGAVLLYLALQRLLRREQRLYCLLAFLTAALCVVASGSRGGGAIAIGAVAAIYLARRSTRVLHAMAFAPLVMMAAATALIAYFVITENLALELFDQEINFTERTFIWQFALRHFHEHPIIGFGLNGFWSSEQILFEFRHEHRWVLDNFHSGYIVILMELGIIGYLLFGAGVWAWARRMYAQAGTTISAAESAATVSFVNMIFLINFTETFFLRSTNIISIVLLILMFTTYADPAEAERRQTFQGRR